MLQKFNLTTLLLLDFRRWPSDYCRLFLGDTLLGMGVSISLTDSACA